MPSRWFCIVILGFWLFSMGWMFKRDWWPWITASDEAPPFVFELADEVVTQNTTWILYRDDKKIGRASTNLAYRKDNTFEWEQSLKKLEYSLSIGALKVDAILPSVSTKMIVTRKGELISFQTKAELELHLLAIVFKAEMILSGKVSQGFIAGDCELKSELGKLEQPYGPVPLKSTNVFSPLQPLFRIGGLYLGRRWKMNQFNPIEESFTVALKELTKKQGIAVPFPEGGSSELLAEVLPEFQTLTLKDTSRKCFVIEYRGSKISARTWVDAEDGRVLRQEALGNGEKLVLERD